MAKEILGLGAKFFGRWVTNFFWEGCMAKYFGGRVAIFSFLRDPSVLEHLYLLTSHMYIYYLEYSPK